MLSQSDQDNLILRHRPLALKLSRQHCPAGMDRDDLFHEACIGLIQAAQSFDPDEAPIDTFGAYARCKILWRIFTAMRAELRHAVGPMMADPPAPQPDPHSEAAANELLSAIEILNADDRELLFDRHGLEGHAALSTTKLCAKHGGSATTIKRRLDWIRAELKLELVKRGWKAAREAPQTQSHLNFA